MVGQQEFFGKNFTFSVAKYCKEAGYTKDLFLQIILPIAKIPPSVVLDCWEKA